MIGRALDSNNDLMVEGGSLKTVNDSAEVVQHVRTRLLFYSKEWFLDRSAGVPYFEEIFVKPVNLSRVESIFKTKIVETPKVKKLIEFSMEYKSEPNRHLTIYFSAETDYGVINSNEVTINV